MEGQGPLSRRHCRLQRLGSGALLRDPLPQVADSQMKVGIDKLGPRLMDFLQRGDRLGIPPGHAVGPAQLE